MTNVTSSASDELLSTIAVLPDQVLLEQTSVLARHEQALQLSVLDHLREIEARRLYLRLGYSSLFDYTVRELHYTEAAAWRRIKAMRLCRETRGVREWLQDGSLNLSNAALLQNSFERWDRNGGGPVAAGSPGPGRGDAGSAAAAAPRALARPRRRRRARRRVQRLPVLDARARQQLVEQAMGKSTRQVQQMLAEVDPEAAAPAERLRALGDGRWELKAVIDAECQRGLQQLRELLSHVDPHLTVGQLVGRLVQEGLERYDPSRPPRRKRRASDPAGEERSSGTLATGDGRSLAATAESQDRAGKSTAPTVSRSAPKRSAKQTPDGTSTAALPAGGDPGETSPKRRLAPPPGSRTSAPKLRCAACRPRRKRDGDAVATEPDCGGEGPRGSRQFDFGAERPTAQDPWGATSTANFGGSIPGSAGGAGSAAGRIGGQIDSGCGQARGLAARPGLLHLRRPAYRAALRLTLLPGAGPHRSGRAGRCCGAGEPPLTLCGSPPLPARSQAALRAARPGDVSNVAAPRIASTRDTSPGGRAGGAECRPRS